MKLYTVVINHSLEFPTHASSARVAINKALRRSRMTDKELQSAIIYIRQPKETHVNSRANS